MAFEQLKNPLLRTRSYAGTALVICLFFLPQSAHAQTADAVSERCQALYNSVTNMAQLAASAPALVTVKQCIDMGIDPPEKARRNNGRNNGNASSSSGGIPSRACPPFEPCLYTTRNSSARGNAYAVASSDSFTNFTGSSTYTAPQLPTDQLPAHLKNGSTIYFYDRVCFTPPARTLLVPDNGVTSYSNGAATCMPEGHIMLPAAEGGVIVSRSNAVTLNQDAKLNFDDSGIAVLPSGFTGTLMGVEVTNATPLYIAHRKDIYLPSGTKIYAIPNNSPISIEDAEQSPPIEYPPYDGPLPQLPAIPPMIELPEGTPPDSQWWEAN